MAQTSCGQCGPSRVRPFPDGLMGAAVAFRGAVFSLATSCNDGPRAFGPGVWSMVVHAAACLNGFNVVGQGAPMGARFSQLDDTRIGQT